MPSDTNRVLQEQDTARENAIRASGLRLDYDTILHIGRHKAGTTALQNALYRNADKLADQGFCYPELYPGMGRIAQHGISEMFQRRRTEDVLNESIAATVSLTKRLEQQRFDQLILSSENFQNTRPEQISLVFNPLRTTVVVYIREQYAYAQSSYSQAVHARNTTDSFEQYLRHFKVNYNQFLRNWIERFAPRELIVRIYARDALVEEDIVEDFCESVGISTRDFDMHNDRTNPSIGGPLLAFKREINALPISLEDLRLAYAPLSQLAEQHSMFRQKPSVAEDQVAAYRTQFVDGNAAVAREFFNRDALFDIKTPLASASQDDVEAIDLIVDGLATTRQGVQLIKSLTVALSEDVQPLSPYLTELKKRL